jgi:hypothetical protein
MRRMKPPTPRRAGASASGSAVALPLPFACPLPFVRSPDRRGGSAPRGRLGLRDVRLLLESGRDDGDAHRVPEVLVRDDAVDDVRVRVRDARDEARRLGRLGERQSGPPVMLTTMLRAPCIELFSRSGFDTARCAR